MLTSAEPAEATGQRAISSHAVPINRLTLAPLVERVAPAVVNIAVLQSSPYAQNPLLRDPYYRLFLGVPDEALAPRISAGSGFVVDAERGLVVTNQHVVSHARAIAVGIGDRQVEAELLGSDPLTDIAVLRIPARGLKALPLGESAKAHAATMSWRSAIPSRWARPSPPASSARYGRRPRGGRPMFRPMPRSIQGTRGGR